jgi:hypothetical protein
MSYFGAKQWLKSHTPLGKFMVHTGMWMTQPTPTDPRAAGSVAGGHS